MVCRHSLRSTTQGFTAMTFRQLARISMGLPILFALCSILTSCDLVMDSSFATKQEAVDAEMIAKGNKMLFIFLNIWIEWTRDRLQHRRGATGRRFPHGKLVRQSSKGAHAGLWTGSAANRWGLVWRAVWQADAARQGQARWALLPTRRNPSLANPCNFHPRC